MPRKPRKCLQGVTYHCYSRCIELRNLLSPDYVKEIAIDVISKTQEKLDFHLIQMEFVENHFHFIIKTTENGETISKIMQYIKGGISRRYNRMNGRTGTFWNERFSCKIIEEQDDPENYLLWLLWYIAYNPVRKKVIRDPRESKFGTIKVYLEENFIPRVKITIHEYFLNLGKTFQERIQKFLKYEELYRRRLAEIYM